eukprot:2954996-Pyramimonas_sp.AAC.1
MAMVGGLRAVARPAHHRAHRSRTPWQRRSSLPSDPGATPDELAQSDSFILLSCIRPAAGW